MRRLFLTGRRPTKRFLPEAMGDRSGGGEGLQRSGVGEAAAVVADLGEHPGAEQGARAGEAEQDLTADVLPEGGFGGLREVVRGLACGVQLLAQGQELVAEGVLDGRESASVLGAEDVSQPLGFGVEGPGAAAALQVGA